MPKEYESNHGGRYDDHEDSDDLTDSEVAYRMTRTFIANRTVAHVEQRGVREQEIKLSLCSHGTMPVEVAETALRALAENGEIVRGDRCVTIDCEHDDWYRQVISWAAEQDEPPRGLIGACNRRLDE